ncbi:MAG: helix-turn-helix transcriptional regulator [Bacteroidales bacterium]|nr:helix-turn-helix transcriptional regulator [Bacteroidales bacterium]MBN2821257.1 helix-turn-helix transcriptional regulator [Bacteroidales bacterium]
MKNKISSELLKGSLKPIILKLLKEQGRMYGYEITQQVEELSKGKIVLTYGALYPILHKLENDEIVITEQEIVNNRTRVYYKLTPKGSEKSVEKIREMEAFLQTLGILFKPSPNVGLCNT